MKKLTAILLCVTMLSSCATARKSRASLTDSEYTTQSAITKGIWGALTFGAIVFVASRVDD